MTGVSIHVQCPLVPSDHLSLVPGSHRRGWTDIEREICVPTDGPHTHSDSMPVAVSPAFEPGDIIVVKHADHLMKVVKTHVVLTRRISRWAASA